MVPFPIAMNFNNNNNTNYRIITITVTMHIIATLKFENRPEISRRFLQTKVLLPSFITQLVSKVFTTCSAPSLSLSHPSLIPFSRTLSMTNKWK